MTQSCNFTTLYKKTAKTCPPAPNFAPTTSNHHSPPPSHTHRFKHRPFSDIPFSIKSPTPQLCRGRASQCTNPILDLQLPWKRKRTYYHQTHLHTPGGMAIKHGLLCFVLGHVLWESVQFCNECMPCFPACPQLIGPLLWRANFYQNNDAWIYSFLNLPTLACT